jgi:hypothetical protein
MEKKIGRRQGTIQARKGSSLRTGRVMPVDPWLLNLCGGQGRALPSAVTQWSDRTRTRPRRARGGGPEGCYDRKGPRLGRPHRAAAAGPAWHRCSVGGWRRLPWRLLPTLRPVLGAEVAVPSGGPTRQPRMGAKARSLRPPRKRCHENYSIRIGADAPWRH